MKRKKFLLVPGNNSLSHVAKSLAVREVLLGRGHKAGIAVARKHSSFLTALSIDHFVLPDIQENDDSGFPSVEWFREPAHIVNCIKAELKLLQEYRPDRVLGVFRFTLKSSAALAGIPYDSLICGCMVPDCPDVLGFREGEQGRETQQLILDSFFRYAGSKLGAAVSSWTSAKSNGDIRHSLEGERTFLWDFPEFAPLPRKPNRVHVGPLSWRHWPCDPIDPEVLRTGGARLAVISFGTCTVCLSSARRIVQALLDLGYRILFAAGGQKQFLDFMPRDPRVIIQTFAPLHDILPHASLLITHGGQLTVFEALQNGVPVVVMPFQPEQAHNGVCLERLGCGTRFIPSAAFQGNSHVYIDALEKMTDEEIHAKINGLVKATNLDARLSRVRDLIGRYRGIETVVQMLENS